MVFYVWLKSHNIKFYDFDVNIFRIHKYKWSILIVVVWNKKLDNETKVNF